MSYLIENVDIKDMKRYIGLIILWCFALSSMIQAQELALAEDFEELIDTKPVDYEKWQTCKRFFYSASNSSHNFSPFFFFFKSSLNIHERLILPNISINLSATVESIS